MNTQATYKTINDVPDSVKAEWQKAVARGLSTVSLLTYANTRAERLAAMWFARKNSAA